MRTISAEQRVGSALQRWHPGQDKTGSTISIQMNRWQESACVTKTCFKELTHASKSFVFARLLRHSFLKQTPWMKLPYTKLHLATGLSGCLGIMALQPHSLHPQLD